MENQFQALQNWITEILQEIKKDIKTDHLHSDPVFYRTYFGNRPQNRLTTEELFEAYTKELIQGNEDLAAWVVNRWVFKKGDLYQHFADRLSEVNPDFDQIKELTVKQSERVLDGAFENFGAIDTFLFALLNGVVFPEEIKTRLSKAAEAEKEALLKEEQEHVEHTNLEKILASHQREVTRLHDKIAGVQKKYTTDTEGLKKQIKALQQKLNAR
jgi:hypothetical protein